MASEELERTWKETVVMYFEVLPQKLPEDERELPF
jgi:hypothetical protein